MDDKRVVLITGATGGIGKATAKLFHENGWIVLGVGLTAHSDANEIDAFYKVDLRHESEIKHLAEVVTASYGQLNALINCAGVAPSDVSQAALEAMTVESFDKIISVNLRAPWLLSKLFQALLMKTKGSSIVNVSSVLANKGISAASPYSASKGGLCALTRALAVELGPSGIRVNNVLPTFLSTKMPRAYFRSMFKDEHDTKNFVSKLASSNCLQKEVDVTDVAKAILFLSDSTQSGSISGTDLYVDGGASCAMFQEMKR